MTDSVTEIMARAIWDSMGNGSLAWSEMWEDGNEDIRKYWMRGSQAALQALKDAGYAEPVKQERLDAPLAALREIEAFGSVNTGCGFTCAAKALAAISAWEGNEDT